LLIANIENVTRACPADVCVADAVQTKGDDDRPREARGEHSAASSGEATVSGVANEVPFGWISNTAQELPPVARSFLHPSLMDMSGNLFLPFQQAGSGV
jgi:hypothetical protein